MYLVHCQYEVVFYFALKLLMARADVINRVTLLVIRTTAI